MSLNRSELYHFIAEALSDPPDWLALSGRDWPLTQAVANVYAENTPSSAALEPILRALESVAPAPLAERQAGYQALLASGVWLNEAGALNGRLLSDATWEVERWYQTAGLEIPGAELPDHAALELEFLAYLTAASDGDVSQVEEAFLKQHALLWLPQLGRQMERIGGPVYAPVGRLLSSWLELAVSRRGRSPLAAAARLPQVSGDCNLCMACLAACPREAIRVQENPEVTRLVLLVASCNGCGQCARRCDRNAMKMMKADQPAASGWQVLFQSPRGVCAHCGEPLVSQAELQYVAEVLDHPAWLDLCPDCR